MNIKVNGKNVEIKEGATVSEVLASQNITPAGIAVAVDNTVVPRDKYAITTLSEGQSLLIIKAFYGG